MTYDYNKVIIALDTPDDRKALDIVRLLKDKISVFKVGLELFCASGPEIVKKINDEGCKVFLDLKFHDIPNTVAGAVKSCISAGPFMLDVHASGGLEMMTKAKEAAEGAQSGKKPILLAITVLTSLDEKDLAAMNIDKMPKEQVKTLAYLAKKAGLDGVVASPKEISAIRETVGKDFLIVTPGVRPTWAAAGDQKRIMTPAQALDKGANYIVVGRPVTAAADPLDALSKLFQ